LVLKMLKMKLRRSHCESLRLKADKIVVCYSASTFKLVPGMVFSTIFAWHVFWSLDVDIVV
jgi:hypothetical protein